jgi:hypothetical protein
VIVSPSNVGFPSSLCSSTESTVTSHVVLPEWCEPLTWRETSLLQEQSLDTSRYIGPREDPEWKNPNLTEFPTSPDCPGSWWKRSCHSWYHIPDSFSWEPEESTLCTRMQRCMRVQRGHLQMVDVIPAPCGTPGNRVLSHLILKNLLFGLNGPGSTSFTSVRLGPLVTTTGLGTI